MISGLHIGSHFRKLLNGKLPPLALIAVMLLPLLFGGLFVWSYWDPLGNLNKIPVALVNSDEGAEGPDGEEIHAGDQVAEKLLEIEPMNFVEVSAEDARQGIAEGKYYLGVEIPKDFSESSVSVNSDHPHPAKINVTLNNTNGFIPTMLGNQVTRVMTSVIGETVGEQISRQLFMGFNTIGDGMDKAADGADQLHDGAGKAKDGGEQIGDGAGKLNDGLQQAKDKTPELVDGIEQLDDGATDLDDGANRLNDGLGEASDGADELADGMGRLRDGVNTLGAGAAAVSAGVDKVTGIGDTLEEIQAANDRLNSSIDQAISDLENVGGPAARGLVDRLRQIQDDAGISVVDPETQEMIDTALDPATIDQLKELRDGAAQLADELNNPAAQFVTGINDAADGAQRLSDALHLLHDGSGQLVAGTARLTDGTSKLVVGARTLADGTTQLADGSEQLVVGMDELNDGLVQLDDGSGELALKITEGSEQVPSFEGSKLDEAADVAGAPVRMQNTGDDLTTFGQGLSPFFLSLSLWFGGLILFMIFNPISRRAIDSGTNPARVVMGSWIPAVLVGLVQAFNLWAVQHFVLDVNPQHPFQMLLALGFIAAVFNTAILAIYSLFGPSVGRLITMVLMSLQLVASNGLYPPEVQPDFIQWVHSWDPMRFSVDLMRHTLFGTLPGDNRVGIAVAVLGALGVASFLLAMLGFWKERVLMEKDIHPELDV
ncbi:YhgE/Pip domain-containing protein [Corynebacterium sp. Marseille-P3884]|uniref:YhgE/Pip domain-containing protein n=1 Tax=Corynebacterium sp. Marseille-P3884 TaxID=2495409 RepID=UPI001B33B645|nr:YhgE/Pip domain-containing protein [Corynebacterium sp. Marseille-P3884]MBP3948403.1 YhgE/Pip domain-containing protein [Corynebacterium sp. Marseille-P3884]